MKRDREKDLLEKVNRSSFKKTSPERTHVAVLLLVSVLILLVALYGSRG